MKKWIALLVCMLALTACDTSDDSQSDQDEAAQQDEAEQSSSEDFDDEGEKRSYALGMDIGKSLEDMSVDVDIKQLTAGIRDVVEDKDTRLDDDELHEVMQGIVSDMESAQQAQEEKDSKANLEKGQAFLEDNKDKEGVKTLEDGLQYKVLKEGEGDEPGEQDTVTVRYTGKLIDGTVFDSSEDREEPVSFPVDAVIPGWAEALQLMKPGGKYRLFIPPDLAYGERGAGSEIGPNETLIFDVELISVDNAEADDDSGQDNEK